MEKRLQCRLAAILYADVYEFMGAQQVKNIEEPVRAYKVGPASQHNARPASLGKSNLELPDKP